MRARGAIAALLFAALLVPGAARADEPRPPPSAAAVDQAKRLFDEATEALRVGRFADAVKALRASFDLVPRTATAFNLAVALRGTGDVLGALGLFDRLLSGELGALDAAKRAQVAELRAEVARDVAAVTITATGAEAVEVRLDGRILGVTRGEPITAKVNPGAHRIVASAPDRETAERALDVAPGASPTVALTLRPARDERPGHVVLGCADAGATLSIDGVGSARGQLERDLAPGEYQVRVRTRSGERKVRLVVPAGRTVKLLLDPPSSSAAASPWLWVGVGVLVTGGVVGAVVATRPRKADPVTDPFWGVTSTAYRF